SWSGTKDMPAIGLATLDRWKRITTASDADLWKLLGDASVETRRRAGQQLVSRANRDQAAEAKARERLIAFFLDKMQPTIARTAAIRFAPRLADQSVYEALYQLLADPNADLVRS